MPILEERLELLPYTRYCTPCAAEVQDGRDVNLNDGRALGGFGSEERPARGDAEPTSAYDERAQFTDLRAEEEVEEDVHAVGTAGGGTAVGGLAGTNVGEGDPEGVPLEEAMGSGNFDVEVEADDEDTTAYAGPGSGAVGGTPADKRAVGGRTGGGIAPHPEPGDAVIGG